MDYVRVDRPWEKSLPFEELLKESKIKICINIDALFS